METYIKDLNLSPEVKTALSWCLGITKVSDLEGLNYLTFANRCPKNYNVLAIADELNALGYLYPPENEISVYENKKSFLLQKKYPSVNKILFSIINETYFQKSHSMLMRNDIGTYFPEPNFFITPRAKSCLRR